MLKRWVFNARRKEGCASMSPMSEGRLFQTSGPLTENARRLNCVLVLVRRTTADLVVDDCSWCWCALGLNATRSLETVRVLMQEDRLVQNYSSPYETFQKHLILFHMSNLYIVSNHMVLVTRCYIGSKTFFFDRSHCTRVGKPLSDFVYLISGVVQCSDRGPLLFV